MIGKLDFAIAKSQSQPSKHASILGMYIPGTTIMCADKGSIWAKVRKIRWPLTLAWLYHQPHESLSEKEQEMLVFSLLCFFLSISQKKVGKIMNIWCQAVNGSKLNPEMAHFGKWAHL